MTHDTFPPSARNDTIPQRKRRKHKLVHCVHTCERIVRRGGRCLRDPRRRRQLLLLAVSVKTHSPTATETILLLLLLFLSVGMRSEEVAAGRDGLHGMGRARIGQAGESPRCTPSVHEGRHGGTGTAPLRHHRRCPLTRSRGDPMELVQTRGRRARGMVRTRSYGFFFRFFFRRRDTRGWGDGVLGSAHRGIHSRRSVMPIRRFADRRIGATGI